VFALLTIYLDWRLLIIDYNTQVIFEVLLLIRWKYCCNSTVV